MASRKGFTLLEVLVALGIFMLALASLPGVLIAAIKADAYAQRLTTATNFAQDRMETVRNLTYTNVTGGTDNLVVALKTYVRTWTVSAGPTATTRTLTVTVTWTDTQSRQVTFQTIVGE